MYILLIFAYHDLNMFGSGKIPIFFIFPYKFLDNDIKEMLIPSSPQGLAAEFRVQLPVRFSLHDENRLASMLWSGIGRFVVTRLEINPNSEEALT